MPELRSRRAPRRHGQRDVSSSQQPLPRRPRPVSLPPGLTEAHGRPGSGRRRLRVLQMVGFLSRDGGAERFMLGLTTHLPRDRFEPWVCAPRGAEPAAVQELAEAGIPFVDLGRRGRWDAHRTAGLLSLLRRERFSVLHTHMFGSNLWGALMGPACGVPVVIAHEHTWSYEGKPWRAWLDGRVIGRRVTRFIAVSAADAQRMVSIERVPPEKVTVIPTALIPRVRLAEGDLRAELGLEPGTPLIGSVAQLRRQKALDVLIDAHARVLEAIPSAHLVVAGDGDCRAELERHAIAAGVADRTHFLGRRDDVDCILEALDVAAMSSDFEGRPLFALECMALGTPLVATAVGGLPEMIDDGRTGLLVPPRRADALADALVSLLLDPGRRGRIAAAAATQVDRIDAVAAQFAELYERLVRETGARRRSIGARPERTWAT
jgi:glycosyltransferase involved in cell wall biosynthesis